jgi:GNAT superfamily N-acetyltransferase
MGDLTVRLLEDVDEVERVAGGWLREHRIEANVPATILAGAVAAARTGEDGRSDWSWVVTVDASDGVVGLAVQTPPHPAVVASPDADVAVRIADAWHAAGRALPGVTGPVAGGAAFARRWTGLTGRPHRIVMREGLHVLGEFSPATGVRGRARTAGTGDLDLVVRWLEEFETEAMSHLPARPDVEVLRRRLAAGELVLWEDAGVAVSLAVWRTAGGVGRIGPVYTPPEHRRHGYGAAVTSAATQAILDAGAEAMLYTDLANPTSNGVYARLGYRMTTEAADWVFDERPPVRS